MDAIHDPITGRSWATPGDLLQHLLKAHHAYLRSMLPHLDRLAEQVARERRVPPEYVDRFQREFTALADLLEDHLARAEGWMFPHIRQLAEAVSDFGWACELEDGLETVIAHAARENQEALERVERLRDCLGDVRWQDQGPSAAQLIHSVQELAYSLAVHVRLENDILFPRVREMLQARGVRAMAF